LLTLPIFALLPKCLPASLRRFGVSLFFLVCRSWKESHLLLEDGLLHSLPSFQVRCRFSLAPFIPAILFFSPRYPFSGFWRLFLPPPLLILSDLVSPQDSCFPSNFLIFFPPLSEIKAGPTLLWSVSFPRPQVGSRHAFPTSCCHPIIKMGGFCTRVQPP